MNKSFLVLWKILFSMYISISIFIIIITKVASSCVNSGSWSKNIVILYFYNLWNFVANINSLTFLCYIILKQRTYHWIWNARNLDLWTIERSKLFAILIGIIPLKRTAIQFSCTLATIYSRLLPAKLDNPISIC